MYTVLRQASRSTTRTKGNDERLQQIKRKKFKSYRFLLRSLAAFFVLVISSNCCRLKASYFLFVSFSIFFPLLQSIHSQTPSHPAFLVLIRRKSISKQGGWSFSFTQGLTKGMDGVREWGLSRSSPEADTSQEGEPDEMAFLASPWPASVALLHF